MNLDLLKKLLRLANNNPNDNEANLAARKVCRMLADAEEKGELRWGSKSKTSAQPQSQYQSRPYASPFESIIEQMRKMQEEEAKRRAEASDERRRKEQQRQQSTGREARWSWFDEPPPNDFDPFKAPWVNRDNPFTGSAFTGSPTGRRRHSQDPEREKQKRPLACCRCGQEFQTMFVGPPQMFKCNTCHWAEYREEQERKHGSVR